LAKKGTVSNCLFYETTVGGTATFTDTLMRDPMFANAAGKNFMFKKNSPAIGAGTAGSNIGDPRWGVQPNVRAFEMGDPSSNVVIYDPEYTLSWSANDPADTATITLEYAKAAAGPWTKIADKIALSVFQYKWNMKSVGYGTYYVRGTLTGETPIPSVAAGTIQYKELVPEVYYVTTTGKDANDGRTWATAKKTIASALSAARLSDTIKVAEGTYSEYVSLKDGIHIFGSYSVSTGKQDIDATPTILDGKDLEHFLIVKYNAGCTRPTFINSLILQNAESSADGGGAYIRENCTLENCIIRNCYTPNGGGGVYNGGGTIRNCTIELCSSDGAGGAVDNKGGVVENCIIRGNQGNYASVRNREGGIVCNCVFYNNQPSGSDWPNTGGVYNPSGTVYNCTFACNYGDQYAGTHSDGVAYNNVFWNNVKEDGFADPNTYIASSEGGASGDNAGDEYFQAENFTVTLNADNMHKEGPHFVAPTPFVGVPTNAGRIETMRAASFALLSGSPLIDKGRSKGAPATDIEGTKRPQKSGVDIGAYEYVKDPDPVAVTGVNIYEDTLYVVEEDSSAFTVIFTPKKATNRNVTWWIENKTLGTIDNYGCVKGLKVGTTRAAVKTADGNFTDTAYVVITPKPIPHPEVAKADSLYKIENYTIPSYIPMWVAKEAARKDSSEANIQALRDKIKLLVTKEYPYSLIANINGDPTTRMAFNWFTNNGVTKGEVQIVAKANATAADFSGDGVIKVAATATATKALNYAVSTSGIIKATKMDRKTAYTYIAHKALAENLTPGTTYSYRVGYDSYWSEIATFQTAKADKSEYSFLYMTDSHIMNQEYVDNARWCATAAIKNVSDAKFCVFPGDFVETGTKGNSEWEWERWFEESMRPALNKIPFVVTDGNHDDTENLNYDSHFNTDNQFNKRSLVVKPQFQGITYSFVYGDVLFLVYSLQDYWRGDYSYTDETSVYLTTDLGNWFHDQVAAHHGCKYRVTLCHKNVFSGSGHQEDEETPMFRSAMLPILKEYEIDLALQGHDHCYEVMGPVNPDTRKPIMSAISGVDSVAVDASTNMTGKSGGTFTVDDGTLYFIGATCGRKRYYPYTREEMEAQKGVTKMENYFDLFTSKFGQPGKPSFTKITVKSDGLYLDTYQVEDENGKATLYNSIKVVRTKAHTEIEPEPESLDRIDISSLPQAAKYICNGQLYIVRDGVLYNAMGQVVR